MSKRFSLLDDSDYQAIAAEIGQELGIAVTVPWLEDQCNALLESTGEVLDDTDLEEIAAEIKTEQDIEAAMREREAEVRERLTPYDREIEDLRQKLARKERQEETAWAVWGTVFLLLFFASVVTGTLGSLFKDAFLIELALCLLLMVVVSLVFPEVVVRTPGVTRSGIWQRFFNRPSHLREV
jgi:hypothetical protein